MAEDSKQEQLKILNKNKVRKKRRKKEELNQNQKENEAIFGKTWGKVC
ncbi:MAG: hypothetical protein ACTSP3_04570 [Candidatus Heimdallarchaeaceae archaeon]